MRHEFARGFYFSFSEREDGRYPLMAQVDGRSTLGAAFGGALQGFDHRTGLSERTSSIPELRRGMPSKVMLGKVMLEPVSSRRQRGGRG